MAKLVIALAMGVTVAGCAGLQPKPADLPSNAGYCASLSLLLDSVDPRMAAQARDDMQTAGCAASG